MAERDGVEVGRLVLVGSSAPQARALVDRLAEEGALVLTIHREAVLNEDESYLMGIRSGAAVAIRQGRTVVVRSENWPEALLVTRNLAARRGISAEQLEGRVLRMLARVAQGVVESTGCHQVLAVGTDTGAAVSAALAAGAGPLQLVIRPGSSDGAEA